MSRGKLKSPNCAYCHKPVLDEVHYRFAIPKNTKEPVLFVKDPKKHMFFVDDGSWPMTIII